MQTNEKGLSLIKNFEGCRLKAYLCSSGIPTIGYGHTGPDVKMGMTITQQQAEDFFKNDLKSREKEITQFSQVDLNSDQFSALVSFAYNAGIPALKNSTLMKYINTKRTKQEIIDQFLRWTKNIHGKDELGLLKRRCAEASLYFSIYPGIDYSLRIMKSFNDINAIKKLLRY